MSRQQFELYCFLDAIYTGCYRHHIKEAISPIGVLYKMCGDDISFSEYMHKFYEMCFTAEERRSLHAWWRKKKANVEKYGKRA